MFDPSVFPTGLFDSKNYHDPSSSSSSSLAGFSVDKISREAVLPSNLLDVSALTTHPELCLPILIDVGEMRAHFFPTRRELPETDPFTIRSEQRPFPVQNWRVLSRAEAL